MQGLKLVKIKDISASKGPIIEDEEEINYVGNNHKNKKRVTQQKYNMPRVPKPYLRNRASSIGPVPQAGIGSRGVTPIMDNLSTKCQSLFDGFEKEIGHMDNTFDKALEDNEKHFLMAYQVYIYYIYRVT